MRRDIKAIRRGESAVRFQYNGITNWSTDDFEEFYAAVMKSKKLRKISFEKVDFSKISHNSIVKLADAIRDTKEIDNLVLYGCDIGNMNNCSFTALMRAIADNKSIKTLRIDHNDFGNKGKLFIDEMSNILAKNKTMTSIDLWDHSFESYAFDEEGLRNGFMQNYSLVDIKLLNNSWSQGICERNKANINRLTSHNKYPLDIYAKNKAAAPFSLHVAKYLLLLKFEANIARLSRINGFMDLPPELILHTLSFLVPAKSENARSFVRAGFAQCLEHYYKDTQDVSNEDIMSDSEDEDLEEVVDRGLFFSSNVLFGVYKDRAEANDTGYADPQSPDSRKRKRNQAPSGSEKIKCIR